LRQPLLILVSSAVIFFASLGLTQFISKTFIPNSDNGEFEVTLELPAGTSLDSTSKLAREIEDVMMQEKAIETTAVIVGSRNKEPNLARVYARLVPMKKRSIKTSQLKELMRTKMEPFKSRAIVNVQDFDFIGAGQRPFVLVIS
jgi:HAE1 family hydrophobic/amphiphilic exporter-1